MEQHLEQCYAIKFCVRLNKTATETLGMIQEAYKEEAMTHAMVFMWNERFQDGPGNVKGDNHSGKPSLSQMDQNVERVHELLNNDHRLSIRLISDELRLSQSTLWRILTENLMMRKVCAKSLSVDQKEQHKTVC